MNKIKKEKKLSKKIIFIVSLVLVLIDLVLCFGLNWILKNIGAVSIDEVIFHLKVPLKGTSHEMVFDAIFKCLLPSILLLVTIIILFKKNYNKTSQFTIKFFKKTYVVDLKTIMRYFLFVVSIVVLVTKLCEFDQKFKLVEYIDKQHKKSKFIEENYVDSSKVKISFDGKKRNLIYIYLESMEANYMNKKNGGSQKRNLIPELTDLAYKYTSFSDTDKLGGAHPITGATWTVGGMVAQTSGIPLNIPIDWNAYQGYNEFLPGAYSLGDILHKNGYNQMLMVGSDADFAGRKTYFQTHGNYKIKDLYTARKEKFIKNNYYKFWGFEDSKLFKYAKTEITKLSKKDKPFNFTMLTVNTHYPDGYLEKYCENEIDNQYASVITCSSQQVYEFVEWIKEQDFYEDTTIILVGDHLSMADNKIFNIEYEDRRIYNVIINSAIEEANTENRTFTSFDMFPTTLASIGASIKGDKLGLGTNLYSDKETLTEKYDIKYVNEELKKKSDFYNKNILYKR